jgi:diaminopimelate epimerase
MRRGLVERKVIVTLPGGPLSIQWRDDDEIVMTGPATESFRGSFDAAAFGLGKAEGRA